MGFDLFNKTNKRMKHILSLCLFALLALNLQAAEGIQFFKGSWAEAKDKAIKEDKVIFVDAYTSWCGPCKRMAKNVFPKKDVGDYYNNNFICLKLDMEKDKDGPSFAREYSVRSYPTLLFIDGGGEVVHRAIGGKQPSDFIKLGQMVSQKIDKSEDYAKEYEEGKRDPDFIYKYIKALNKADKPSLKIANEYIKSQDDLSTPFNTKFLFEAVTESDSRLFDLMIKNKANIIKMFGQESFDQKVILVTNKTINKAVEYESMDLLAEAKDKINVISDKERAKLFHLRADKKYYLLTGDVKNYLKSTNKYVKEMAGKDANLMEQLSLEVKQYLSTDTKALKKGEEWAKAALDLEETSERAFTYADFLYINDNPKKALEAAENGMEIAKAEGKNPAIFVELIRKINLNLSE